MACLYRVTKSFNNIYIMSRDYCFTCFDTEMCEFNKENVKYICYGREVCPTTQKEHLQGFAMFKRTCRMPKAKEWLGSKEIHVESRKGTRDQAREYCKKDGKFWEWGEYERLSNKEMLKMPVNYIKENEPLLFVRYHNGIEKLNMDKGDKWRKLEVVWLWGEAGSGKTREAMAGDSVFKLDRPYQWFDGYEGEDTLVLDDVVKEDFRENRGLFLNLLDGYQLRLNIKGSYTYAKWTKVYITSNWMPEVLMYQGPWCRRVTSVRAV